MISNKFIQRLVKACQVVVLTGNGIKAESVKSGNLFNEEKLSFKEQRDKSPEKFWQKVAESRRQYAQLQPNLGHFALVDLENRFEDFMLITTSFDGLHRRAGNKNLIELKGNVFQNRCHQCGAIFEADEKQKIPVCPECGSTDILPNVLQTNESPEESKLKQAQRVSAEAEVFVTAGFNDTNEDINALPFIAKANGAYLLELNPEKTTFSSAMNEMIAGNPAKFLTAIALLLEKI